MATKSPTSVRLREIIGVNQFSQRREVFDKHDTVFLPLPSPTTLVPNKEVEPIITSNHGKTTSNFKRNAPGYSSMREPRTEDRNIEFRARKYSDNFTSDLNQDDDANYRYSMTERTRRLSKMRREFLNSNLHEPGSDSPFTRTGVRASLPASSVTGIKYKIESPNLYKFPFAEPYATPPPVRRIVVDLGPAEINGEKENEDPEAKPRHKSMPAPESSPKVDHQKLFEELVKRYSPQRKPVDWKLPPTRPRVVGSVPKSSSSVTDSVDSTDRKLLQETVTKSGDDDVFLKENNVAFVEDSKQQLNKPDETVENATSTLEEVSNPRVEVTQNGPELVKKESSTTREEIKERESKTSLTELEEKNDEVPELSTTPRLSKESGKRPSLDKYTDVNIPKLIEKMTEEAEDMDNHQKKTKKVKRKRSFLDKLLGRKKEK